MLKFGLLYRDSMVGSSSRHSRSRDFIYGQLGKVAENRYRGERVILGRPVPAVATVVRLFRDARVKKCQRWRAVLHHIEGTIESLTVQAKPTGVSCAGALATCTATRISVVGKSRKSYCA